MNSLFDFVPIQWAVAVLLLSLRIGALLLATPVFSAADIPQRVRVLVMIGLAAALCLGLGLADAGAGLRHVDMLALATRPGMMIRAAATEVALGATMGIAVHAGFAAFSMAGGLLDVQLGFGLSQIFDPATNAISTVLTTTMTRLAVLMFFLVDGHHALLRALVFSLDRVPLGAAWDLEATMGSMLGHVAALFALSIALVAPIVFSLLLAELALGVMARNLPQMNMLSMGLPVKVAIGLGALCAWFTGIGAVMDRVYGGIFEAMSAALGDGGAVAGAVH